MPYLIASSRYRACCSIFYLLILLCIFFTSLSASRIWAISISKNRLTDEFRCFLLYDVASSSGLSCWVWATYLTNLLDFIPHSCLQSLDSCQELLIDLNELLDGLIWCGTIWFCLLYYLLQFLLKLVKILLGLLWCEVYRLGNSFGWWTSRSVVQILRFAF